MRFAYSGSESLRHACYSPTPLVLLPHAAEEPQAAELPHAADDPHAAA